MASREELLAEIEELKAEIERLKAMSETVIHSSSGSLHSRSGLAYVELPSGALFEVWRNTTTNEGDPPGSTSAY